MTFFLSSPAVPPCRRSRGGSLGKRLQWNTDLYTFTCGTSWERWKELKKKWFFDGAKQMEGLSYHFNREKLTKVWGTREFDPLWTPWGIIRLALDRLYNDHFVERPLKDDKRKLSEALYGFIPSYMGTAGPNKNESLRWCLTTGQMIAKGFLKGKAGAVMTKQPH